MIKEAIEAIVNDERDITEEEAAAMREIFSGEVTPRWRSGRTASRRSLR